MHSMQLNMNYQIKSRHSRINNPQSYTDPEIEMVMELDDKIHRKFNKDRNKICKNNHRFSLHEQCKT